MSKVSSKSRSNKKLARLRRRGTVEDPYFDRDSAYFKEYFGQDDGSDSQSAEKSPKNKYKQTLDPKRRGNLLPLLIQHSEGSALLKGSSTFKSPGPSRKRRHTILSTSPRMLRQDQSVRQIGLDEQDLSET